MMILKSTKRILFLILFVFSLCSLSFGQQIVKIGVINSQDILEKSTEGKRVISQLQDRDKKYQSDLAKLDDEIRKLETKLNTQRLTLTDEALLALNSDLEKKRTDRKRLAEDAARDIQDLQFRLFNRVQSELLPIIEQLGKEKGLDIIFDLTKSGAVYFSPVIDLTEEVIKRYDASKATKK